MSDNYDNESIRKDLDALRKDLRELAESVRASGEKQAQERLDQVRHQYEDLRDQASQRSKAVGAEIEARPFISVLSAFGIGLLLGKIFGR